MQYKAVLFDLDDTLAESFQPPSKRMLELLSQLLESVPLAILTGASFERVYRDFLVDLASSPHIANLFILPNSGGQAYTWQDGWNEEYNHAMDEHERERVKRVLKEACDTLPMIKETESYGERIADREVQIAFTVIGILAPRDAKKLWDPDASKRREIARYLQPLLPDYDIRTGGAATIDITKKGVNKAYGVRWLSERLKVDPKDMLFVGDALYESGNDAAVIPTGIVTRPVVGPAETEKVIEEFLSDTSCG